MPDVEAKPAEYGLSPRQWALRRGLAVAVYAMFHGTIAHIVKNWQREEYSHGYLIPVISALLLWQRRRDLQKLQFPGVWAGPLLLLAGIALYFINVFAGIATVDAYALVIV